MCAKRRSNGRRSGASKGRNMARIDRSDYAALYGPTTGDSVRLGDTALTAVDAKDVAVYCVEYPHGGGKTPRDRIGSGGIRADEGSPGVLCCETPAVRT